MRRFFQRWLFALGGFSQNTLQNSPAFVVGPIYNIGLGVSPVLIGVAMAIPRVWEIFFDPWLGRASDRTVSRLGRRRPFIIGGGLAAGLLFAPLWWVPDSWSHAAQGAWLIAFMLLFYTAYSVFAIPFAAFTIEVVRGNEPERLRLNGAISSLINFSTLPMGWLLWLCQRPVFASPVQGIRYVGVAFGLIIAGCAVIPALIRREPLPDLMKEAPAGAVLPTMPLLRLLAIRPLQLVLLAVFSIVFGFSLVTQLGFYVLAYRTCRGDLETASYIFGLSSTLRGVLGTVAAPLVAMAARHVGRHRALMPCLALGALGSLSMWWTLGPRYPYLNILSTGLISFSLASFWTIVPAILGSVSDDIERRTGLACQGIISGVYGISSKLAVSFSLILTGYVLVFCGFDVKETPARMAVPLEWMSLVYALLPCAGLVLSGIALWGCRVSTGTGPALAGTES